MSRRRVDPARRVAFDALRAVHAQDAYANLVLPRLAAERRLDARDAGFATELVAGTFRHLGTYDAILEAASGRRLGSLQPAVLDVLRLGTHQLLGMRVPAHAAVGASVDLAAGAVGERVTGLVNAVLRKVARHDLDAWLAELSAKATPQRARSLATHHPEWIVDAFTEVLGADEADAALAADNEPPVVTLVVRPGLADRAALGGEPTQWSPFGARVPGNPADLPDVRAARAGVQDEGSQLVALALSRVEAPSGPWLDLCAGPGGKAALLAGLARQQGSWLLASERQPHRARLVAQALRAYPGRGIITADGTQPAWQPGRFARVMADVPCTGLGALRRRPESRWRRRAGDVEDLHPLQVNLLRSALDAAAPAGVVAYVTCSPHTRETVDVVAEVLADRDDTTLLDAPAALSEVPDTRRGEQFVQLWPHRHGTDAMFLALLRKDA